VSGGWTDSKAETPSPGTVTNPLIESWEFAEAVGAYDFRADTQQTLRPRSVPGMIGQTSQSVNMSLDGEMVSPYEAHLTVRMERAGLDPTPVTLVQEGSQTYVLKDGEKIPTQNPLGALAPTGNYASYLAAAENVAPCEGETFLPGTVACYTYDINGKRFAEFIRDQMQALLDRNPGALPSGAEVKVAPSPQLVKMSGTGKVMLDANNLPLRLVLNIDMPEVNQLYDSKSRAVVDFEFDPAAVQAAMDARTHDESLSGHLDLGNIDFSGLITFLVTVIPASLLVACRRRRWFYGAVAVTVVLSMVSVPLVQAAAYSRYFGGQVQAAEALNELFTLAGVTEAAPNGVEPRPNLKSAQAIETFEPSAYCGKDAGVNRDTDGDGLADDAEYCLGTNPYTSDSDYDGLSDGLETAGFEYNGKTWYSNPLRPDSNGDGQNDSLEWKTDDGYAAEWDLDGDGTPNIWDFDDDGDGVGDGLDYSPHSRTGYILGASGGGDAFAFDITGQYNGYVYLDMQVQPSDVNHLRYGVTALDWRSPDAQGQITELNGSVDDVRLIPMLEVETNVPPNYDLAQEYGVTVFTDTLGVGVQRLSIPLHLRRSTHTSSPPFV
jgi:hypothetical protein